jgi:phage terminase large subunit-like protein
MLSAPAHIPPITVSSFGIGFAAPDRIRGVVIDTFSPMISGSRVCSASPSRGNSPA